MKITRLRHNGVVENKDALRQELQEVSASLQKAIDFYEFHKQFQDHNLTNMWLDEIEHLNSRARDLLKRLGL
jgi:mRNA-degrading endonuclease YafQ of YafQ-DinJ toxin-antitoxin module